MKSDLQYAIERNVATNRRAIENYNLLRQQEQNLDAEEQHLVLNSENLSNN
ncbi:MULTISPECIES: hypothetical protein [unclassified Agarivorans]|uniref:hypothetical protein n=1 Tax=unclassified Agarivorans TaxID=2636026 RepID=UPI0026E32327|nr:MULTISPECIES: hypothetical protein [unclassified Agarivorans]MDO6686410.1 hypothetical protein [Agarivorans sp. 3_MG-2023]MDO6713712.1 hypothetical protein [Agarivorans sp. 2_MG-2023]